MFFFSGTHSASNILENLKLFGKINAIAQTKSMIKKAVALYQQKQYQQAVQICQQILEHNEEDKNAWHLLGVICFETGDFKQAITFLTCAHQLAKHNPDILTALASSYLKTGQTDEAASYYQMALQLDENNPQLLQQCINLLLKTGDNERCENYLQRLLRLTPDNAQTWNLLGVFKRSFGMPSEAEQAFEQSLKLDETDYRTRLNLASLAQNQGKLATATAHYSYVLTHAQKTTIPPEIIARTYYNLGLIQLGEQQFATGWQNIYLRPKHFSETLSSLNNLVGKKILIAGEEGIGDELMLLRYLPLLKKYKTHNHYLCNPKLKTVLQTYSDIQQVISHGDPVPACDHHISLFDLPYLLSREQESVIPPPLTLTISQPQNDTINFEFGKKPWIGISWRAGVLGENNTEEKFLRKSIPLKFLADIFKNFDGTIVILQREPEAGELENLQSQFSGKVINASSYNNDLLKMTSLLQKLDGYVGVSNTNMHLYGSLDKKACVVIPNPGEWRWLYQNDSSPWYPNFTLARQQDDGTWEAALERCHQYLDRI